jgi:hypothetical protein
MLANAAQQPELPEDGEAYQHEQQEVYDPMIEQAEQENEQMPVDIMTQNNINKDDISSLQLPNLQQNNEVM